MAVGSGRHGDLGDMSLTPAASDGRRRLVGRSPSQCDLIHHARKRDKGGREEMSKTGGDLRNLKFVLESWFFGVLARA